MSGVPIPDLQGFRDGRGGVGEGVQITHADFGVIAVVTEGEVGVLVELTAEGAIQRDA